MNTYTEKELSYQAAVKAAYKAARDAGLTNYNEITKFVEPLFAKEYQAMKEESEIQARKNLESTTSAWDCCSTGYAVSVNG